MLSDARHATRRTDGVGLAAPQVGVNKRLMVYNPEGVRGRGVEMVLCNPTIVESSAVEDLFEEGCLSFPRIYADVKARAWGGAARACPRILYNKYTLIRARLRPRVRRRYKQLAEGSCARFCCGCAARVCSCPALPDF